MSQSKTKPASSNQPMRGFGMAPRSRKPKNLRKTLRRLLRYLSMHKLLLPAGLLLSMAGSLAVVIATYYLRPLINGLVQRTSVRELLGDLLMMAAIYLFSVIANYLGGLAMVHVAQRTTHHIRSELFDHMQQLPVSYFDSKTHGELMSRYTNDVDNINIAMEQSLAQSVTALMTVVSTFIMMLILSPALTLIVIVILLIMLWVIKSVGSRSSRYFRQQQKALGELNGYIEEMIEGQKVVKVFNYEAKAKRDFSTRNDSLRHASTNAQTFAGILMPIMGNISYAHYAITAMVGAILAIRGLLDIGSIAVFLQYTRSFAMPITQISNQFNTLIAALAGAERIFELLDEKPEDDSGPVRMVRVLRLADGQLAALPANEQPTEETAQKIWAWKVPQADGSYQLVEIKGEVRFEEVVFGYDLEQTVLKGISLYAKPGQKIALVGSTGAGKTTITNLINRFYDLRQGRITYDGIDISQINKQDLRRTLGMVLQDVHLFQGTIRENIRYGRLDATDSEVEAAARVANAHSFIMRMPEGYDTWLEADGINLSQGQRQLLSIARAAIADPPVLILDEATSSVDTRTERLIEQGMDRLMQGRTTFAIAHRLSTVRHANAIMVLENGEIIERGDHDDLLDLGGRYYQLCTGLSELE